MTTDMGTMSPMSGTESAELSDCRYLIFYFLNRNAGLYHTVFKNLCRQSAYVFFFDVVVVGLVFQKDVGFTRSRANENR